jgi:small subunit ribosomal protein S16
MLKIRLKRTGRKGKAFYKIVLMENLSKRDGKSIEELGYYDPLKKIIKIDRIAFKHYIDCGAYPTSTVRHLIYKLIKTYEKLGKASDNDLQFFK